MKHLTLPAALMLSATMAAAHPGEGPHVHPEEGAAWIIGLALLALAGGVAVLRARAVWRRK
ncbi:hypothetical protein [Aestuariivita sp.]|jgi:hypothetical protein|uniref:hypothetical protein n=1 Tax=Aestuariivita sp. TaxID=1872407 RepID=UPI0021706328|nr:hypothetical protein [Aestuariivita sp.]MCE8009231.1 hypothetical protein [Aestuariivita sp.]